MQRPGVIDNQNYSWYKNGMDKKYVSFSRPKDKSLDAYKAWIKEMTFHLTSKNESVMTEEEWMERWKEFWGKEPKKGA